MDEGRRTARVLRIEGGGLLVALDDGREGVVPWEEAALPEVNFAYALELVGQEVAVVPLGEGRWSRLRALDPLPLAAGDVRPGVVRHVEDRRLWVEVDGHLLDVPPKEAAWGYVPGTLRDLFSPGERVDVRVLRAEPPRVSVRQAILDPFGGRDKNVFAPGEEVFGYVTDVDFGTGELLVVFAPRVLGYVAVPDPPESGSSLVARVVAFREPTPLWDTVFTGEFVRWVRRREKRA
ncbi:hypothetical protein C7438_0193 [Brockia lithotrophica]|uniref:S1 motif domain-containing protein n=1 Tax=Brockia lithotrophica TaxID=933949 RepID=A0A660L5S0_9BACL|nr:hypothetical protein C7438_0193 [Brockia lithotrophica]